MAFGISTPALVAYVICAAMAAITIATYVMVIPKTDGQSAKIMTVVSAFSAATCVVGYFLALWHFSSNPDQMLQFLLAMVMLVVLPASLISAAISTVSISSMVENAA
jgi:hypothetical protein